MALSVEDLRAFTLVVRHRSVSRTAELLGVTQQSVSERVRRLEKRLDADLFVRLPHGMEPTAAGYRLLPYAQRAVALIDQAAEVVVDDDRFRVRVQADLVEAIQPVLEVVLAGFTVEVVAVPSAADVLPGVAEGTADVGFGTFFEVPTSLSSTDHLVADVAWHAPVTVEGFFADPVVAVASPRAALAHGTVRMSDIAAAGVALDGRVEPGSVEVQVSARSKVAARLASGELVQLDVVDWPSWVVPVSLAFRTGEVDRPPIKALRSAASPSGEVEPPTSGLNHREVA